MTYALATHMSQDGPEERRERLFHLTERYTFKKFGNYKRGKSLSYNPNIQKEVWIGASGMNAYPYESHGTILREK